MSGRNKSKLIMWAIDTSVDTPALYKAMAVLPDVLSVNYERQATNKEVEIGFYFKDLHHTLVLGSLDGSTKRFEIDHITTKGVRCATIALNPLRLIEYLTS